MDHKKISKMILVGAAVLVLVSGVGYVFMRLTGVVEPNACISEEKMTIPDLSGAKVEVFYTNCDTMVKDEAISIYFSRAAAKEKSWFAGWRNHRRLVFRYDPGGKSDSPLPSITNPSKSTILISVPEVSSVIYQSRNWESMSIAYEIGKVYYPVNSK